MKIKFEIKGLKVDVEGDVPEAIIELLDAVAKAGLEELAKVKAKAITKETQK